MATPDVTRIAISGAAGRVAYSLMFRIANGGLFGQDHPVALSLLGLPEHLPRLDAHAMELKESAFPLLTQVQVGSDPVRAFEGAHWVILLGGSPLREQPTYRLDLLRENAPIMLDHGRAINRACPSARVLVVVSPCNTNCLLALSHAQDVPREHWFALNQLIRMRACSLVAEKAGVPVNQVTRLTVWGNNSETAYVDGHNARIQGQPADKVITDPGWFRDVLEPTVAGRFREFLRRTENTPAGATAQAILMTIRSITTPTPFEHWFGAGVLSDGSYEVPRGLVFGFPLLTTDGSSWSISQGHYLDAHARERVGQNIAELEQEAAAISHLLGKIG